MHTSFTKPPSFVHLYILFVLNHEIKIIMAQASFVYLQKKEIHYGASLVINDEKKIRKERSSVFVQGNLILVSNIL